MPDRYLRIRAAHPAGVPSDVFGKADSIECKVRQKWDAMTHTRVSIAKSGHRGRNLNPPKMENGWFWCKNYIQGIQRIPSWSVKRKLVGETEAAAVVIEGGLRLGTMLVYYKEDQEIDLPYLRQTQSQEALGPSESNLDPEIHYEEGQMVKILFTLQKCTCKKEYNGNLHQKNNRWCGSGEQLTSLHGYQTQGMHKYHTSCGSKEEQSHSTLVNRKPKGPQGKSPKEMEKHSPQLSRLNFFWKPFTR
ncbi:hypothetical protein EVAR_43403_1 [Eumeta japonica]|uniref:Uncharacterized protein n=1 Tax=Eumeta variegata TaxID=151549 RepID=A0A4C1WTC0_EUMVA|nr:hypothetical protein EVAR_43403_1 [Eumeta japonica]